jgi:hypothetical protein
MGIGLFCARPNNAIVERGVSERFLSFLPATTCIEVMVAKDFYGLDRKHDDCSCRVDLAGPDTEWRWLLQSLTA